MPVRQFTLEDAFSSNDKESDQTRHPANDNDAGPCSERFPKVDDILDRLTDSMPLADPQDD
ncbi:hypothetical protein [Yoonia sp. BS5-3]|uniref:Uncharacterized protein n=1 Tax=Yoonia phaeophyticola TaxID=3137369 RepID=A0ABZ2V4D1_9RHOB